VHPVGSYCTDVRTTEKLQLFLSNRTATCIIENRYYINKRHLL